jgi:dTDP-4-amino-4,6-dideoxygalactose transaminase
MIPMSNLRLQYAGLERELGEALGRVLEEQAFVLGPRVAAFESALAEFLDVPHVVGVKSGSDALLLALLALGIGPGDEVVTTPFSFFATAGAVLRVGAKPVFADVDPGTLALDPGSVRRALGPRTRAILPVHLFGQPAELDELCRLAEGRGVALVEDAAQALGATVSGRAVGGFGRVGCFSFHPSKPLGAFGDAGAVVTRDPELAARLVRLRTHGALRKNEHELSLGGNHRLDALQAAVLSVKLAYLPSWLAARRAQAKAYDEELAGIPGLVLPPRVPGSESSFSAYTLRVKDGIRDALARHLHAAGVEACVYYPKPLHLQPAFSSLALGRGSFPVAEEAAKEVLSIPIYPELGLAERKCVIRAVRQFYAVSADTGAARAGASP